MIKNIFGAFCLGLMATLAIQSVSAQDDRAAATAAAGDKYVISAKAGGVNYVEGSVNIARPGGRSGVLLRRDEIAVGDRVSTGADGRAEILLNPGSFLRVGPNSAFEFRSTSLDDLQIRIDSGSTIFEVYASREFKIRVVTPGAKMLLIESGVFRVDVLPGGGARVAVWEGQALLGDRSSTVLKKGKVAELKDRESTVAKFDRGNIDEFEAWSKSRGKDLAKQTARMKDRSLRNSLMNSFNSGRWGMYSSFGLWIYDASFGRYCFLPFGSGWYSPYGYGYGSGIWGWNLPIIVYTPPVTGGGNGGGNGGGSNGGGAVTPIMSQGDRSPAPPFVRMGGGGGGGGRGITDSGSSTDRTGPVFSPPVFVPPPAPAPAPPPATKKNGNR